MEVARNFLGGRDDVAHVGVLGFAQRGRDADVDGVELGDDGEIGCGAQASGLDKIGQFRGTDVADVGFTGVDAIDFGSAEVDSSDMESGFGVLYRERESHVAEPDDCRRELPWIEFSWTASRPQFRRLPLNCSFLTFSHNEKLLRLLSPLDR